MLVGAVVNVATTAITAGVFGEEYTLKDAVMAAFDEANDVLNYKIAEYTKAVIQNRPNFHINMLLHLYPQINRGMMGKHLL